MAELSEQLEKIGREFNEQQAINTKKFEEIEKRNEATGETKEALEKATEGTLKSSEDFQKLFQEIKARQDLIETVLNRPGGGVVPVESKAIVDYHKAMERALENPLAMTDQKELYALEQQAYYSEAATYGKYDGKTVTASTNTAGGFLIQPEHDNTIRSRVIESSPMSSLATVRQIPGSEFVMARDTHDGAGTGGWGNETTVPTVTTTPTFAELRFSVYLNWEMPKISQEMLRWVPSIEAHVGQEVGKYMGRRAATAHITGSGAGQPRGIMSYTAGTTDTSDQIEQVNTGDADEITDIQKFIELQNKLLEPYAANSTWLMNRASWGTVLQLNDANTVNYLAPDLRSPTGMILLGRPTMFAADVAVEATNALVVAFGDFREAYLIVENVGTRVIRDELTDKPYVRLWTARMEGGGVKDFQAVKILKCAV